VTRHLNMVTTPKPRSLGSQSKVSFNLGPSSQGGQLRRNSLNVVATPVTPNLALTRVMPMVDINKSPISTVEGSLDQIRQRNNHKPWAKANHLECKRLQPKQPKALSNRLVRSLVIADSEFGGLVVVVEQSQAEETLDQSIHLQPPTPDEFQSGQYQCVQAQ
jgi:hypothetical protein